ncbi:hypothetical protein EDB83DRAFT_2314933 [Lactarius deliciosus]|nr:hypothetical protein EDB83DRAFT_2314933 [Lactarius deliciosus]
MPHPAAFSSSATFGVRAIRSTPSPRTSATVTTSTGEPAAPFRRARLWWVSQGRPAYKALRVILKQLWLYSLTALSTRAFEFWIIYPAARVHLAFTPHPHSFAFIVPQVGLLALCPLLGLEETM